MSSPEASPANWTRGERIFFWATFGGGFLWCLAFLLCSPGWSLDDEISHYLRSRSVWENPALIFDVWTRTGRNLFHLIPAHFGLTAARMWTLGFAALAVLVTTRLAGRMGVRRTWLVPLALWFQPWFVELSWGVLTQTPFLLALLGGIWFLSTRRVFLSGLCFGALPLVRHEGMALLAMWFFLAGLEQVRERRFTVLPVVLVAGAIPLALYNLAAWFCTGVLPIEVYFHPKPTEIYGSGPLWHFLSVCLLPAGPFTILLALVGFGPCLRDWRKCWPLLFYPAYFALHSVIFWKGLFASGGYYHFLMPMAPGLAVVAVRGADVLLEGRQKWQPVLARGLLAGVALQGLLLLHVLFAQKWSGIAPQFGLAHDPIHYAIDEAIAWQNSERPQAPAVVCRHIYAGYSQDWIETPEQLATTFAKAAELPTGAIVIWESKYADHTGLPLAELTAPNSGWREERQFGKGSVRVFEKVSF